MQRQLNDITVKLFQYFNSQFKRLDNRFKHQDEHIDGLYRLLDAYIQQLETSRLEALAGEARVARLENQVRLLAQPSRGQQKVTQ